MTIGSQRRRTLALWSCLLASTLLLPIASVSAIPVQLHGLNYNTRRGPDFAWDKCKYYEQIQTELTMLKRITNRIRILSLGDCGQGVQVMEIAQQLGMQVWLGIWVGEDEYVFEDEKGTLFDMIQRGLVNTDTVLGITVGSESLYREEVTSTQIIGYMNQVKGILANNGLSAIPVTITEIAPTYGAYADLRAAVDVIYTNIFPFWEGIPINGAIPDLVEDINWVMNLAESQGKDLVIGETGWPSGGFIEGVGIASPENQVQFFIDFYCQISQGLGWKYYWFTAIDNSWRQLQDPENDVEGNFGFLKDDLTLKPHFENLTFTCDSDGVEYSFAEIDWAIPSITAAPASVPAESCQAHSECSELGLFGNCCPTDGSNGIFLGCCNKNSAQVPSPTPTPTSAPVPSPTPPPTSAPVLTPTPPPTSAPVLTPTTPSTPSITAAPAAVPAESCQAHSRCSELGLFGNCCPTDGSNGIFLGCCNENSAQVPSPTPTPTSAPVLTPTPPPTSAPVPSPTPPPTNGAFVVPTENPTPNVPTPTGSPTRFPTFDSEATVAPTVTPITPPPTIAPATPPPTNAPVTPPPTTAPVTPSTAPVTPPPTVAPVTPPPTVAPVTAAPNADPTTQPPTLAPVTAAPSEGITVTTLTGLQITLIGLTNCNQVCQDAFIRQLVLHTEEFFNGSSGVELLGNTPEVIDIIILDDRRRRILAESDSSAVRITYDHTLAFISDDAATGVDELAGNLLATEPLRQDFVQHLKSDNSVAFDGLEGVSGVVVPQPTFSAGTEAPSVPPPSAAPTTRAPSNISQINNDAAPEGKVFSLGTIIGIAVGGSLLFLICLFCIIVSKRRSKEEAILSEGGYEPPSDDLSYGWSSMYSTK